MPRGSVTSEITGHGPSQSVIRAQPISGQLSITSVSVESHPLRLNVGFIIHQAAGYSRDFSFEIPHLSLPPDLELEEFRGQVRISRTSQGLLVRAYLRGSILIGCARCLERFALPLQTDFSELYAFSLDRVAESGLIVPENGQIDLGDLVREYLLLEVPINPLCQKNCRGLCPECGVNLNQCSCGHRTEKGDPRLAVLASLLTKGDSQKTE
jgi:uncharacterized protein